MTDRKGSRLGRGVGDGKRGQSGQGQAADQKPGQLPNAFGGAEPSGSSPG